MSKPIGRVVASSPSSVQVLVDSLDALQNAKRDVQIGKYLQIEDGNNNHVIAIIQNLKALDFSPEGGLKFIIDCQPIGAISNGQFTRGSVSLPIPTEPADIIATETLKQIFSSTSEYNMPLGRLSQNKDINVWIDGDRFLSKHVAVVGSGR